MNPYLENIIETTLKKSKKKKKPESEIEEIVDVDGKVMGSKIPADVGVKTTTSKKTTDDTVGIAHSNADQGGAGMRTATQRTYWGESDLTKSVGYDDTLGKDKTYDQAKKHFKKKLKMDDEDTEDRLERIGYEKDNNDKVRLIEDDELGSKIDQILQNKNYSSPVVNQESVEINPIIKRQLNSLKQSLKANNISVQDILSFLQDE